MSNRSAPKIITGSDGITDSVFAFPLTIDGTPTGDPDAAVDGSVTPVEFFITPTAGRVYYVTELSLAMAVNSPFLCTGFGNISGGLTNGHGIRLEAGDISQDLNVAPIKLNPQIGAYFSELNHYQFAGNDESLCAKWDFKEHGGVIKLDQGDKIGITVNDNLTTLVVHGFTAHGWYEES